MAAGQQLRGLVGQSMVGRKKSVSVPAYSYPPGSYTFTVPTSGWWRFVLWGAGGKGGTTGGGGGGGFVQADRALSKGQTVAIVAGAPGTSSTSPASSTVTLPSGEVLTAGAGTSNALSAAGGSGTASLGAVDDILLTGGAAGAAGAAGSAGQGTAGGAGGAAGGLQGGGGAAGQSPYRGADGSTAFAAGTAGVANSPGGGAGGTSGTGISLGGGGLVLAHRVRVRAN